METYKPGDYRTMVDPCAPALLPARDATVGIDSALLVSLEVEQGRAHGLDADTLLDRGPARVSRHRRGMRPGRLRGD